MELRKICETISTRRNIAIEQILEKTCNGLDRRTISKISDDDRKNVTNAVNAIQINNDFIITEDKKTEALNAIQTIIEKYRQMENYFAEDDAKKKKERKLIINDVFTFFDKNTKAFDKLSKEYEKIQNRMDEIGMSRFDLNLALDNDKIRSIATVKKVGAYGLLISYFNNKNPA